MGAAGIQGIETIAETIAVDNPLTRNFGGSTYSVLRRSPVVTSLRTHDGLVSVVYNGDNRAHGPEIARLVREVLAPQVTGLSIREGERHLPAGVRHGTYVECFADPARDPIWQTMWANRAGPARRMVRRGLGAGLRHRAGRGYAPALSRGLT